MSVVVSAPYAKVKFATEQGSLEINQEAKNITIDNLDLDIININTDRDVGAEDCPTFTITLVYREEWYKQIHGNDLVEIYLGRGKEAPPVFFGMVDTVQKSMNYIDLRPVRTIVINGRGFNKAFSQFGIGAIQELNVTYSLMGFYEGQAESFGICTPPAVIKKAVDFYMDKGIDMAFANGKRWKDYVNTIYLESKRDQDESLGNVLNSYQYQGGLWDYLKELRNAPFYEAFWEVTEGKPTFIVRPTPFNPEDWTELQLITLDEKQVMNESLGRTDLETYTVFSVKGEHLISDFDMVFGEPVWYKPFYKRYGLRRLQVTSKYINSSIVQQMNTMGGGMAPDPMAQGNFSPTPTFNGSGNLSHPTGGQGRISSRFGPRKAPKKGASTYHKGIDISLDAGSPVYATGNGTILAVGKGGAVGNYVTIQHDNGLVTKYFHLQNYGVQKGQRVTQGQSIGKVGSTGISTGPHLHYEVHVNGKAVNPEPYLSGTKSGKGGKGSPSGPTPAETIQWNINQKTKTEYEKKLEEGRRQFDEFKRQQTQEEIKTEITARNDDRREALEDSGISKPIADIFSQEINRKQNERLTQEKTNATEQMIAEANAGENPTGVPSISQKTIDLFNWNIMNNKMENGTYTLVGNSVYKVGVRLLDPDSNMEYYVEHVNHAFNYNEGWTSTLQVTRGLPYGKRFESPWNEWSLMTAEDMLEITGIDPSTVQMDMSMTPGMIPGAAPGALPAPTQPGLRGRIGQMAKAKTGEPYDNDKRMKPGYSDCSSFVYKRVMEAKGLSWQGKDAPTTKVNQMKSDLWYEIPMSQVQPWDILWRPGHTEFLGDDGRTFGAHQKSRPAGPGGKFSPKNWKKAYRVVGA